MVMPTIGRCVRCGQVHEMGDARTGQDCEIDVPIMMAVLSHPLDFEHQSIELDEPHIIRGED